MTTKYIKWSKYPSKYIFIINTIPITINIQYNNKYVMLWFNVKYNEYLTFIIKIRDSTLPFYKVIEKSSDYAYMQFDNTKYICSNIYYDNLVHPNNITVICYTNNTEIFEVAASMAIDLLN